MRSLTWNSIAGGVQLESELVIIFVFLVGGLMLFMMSGLPIAFCFLLMTMGGLSISGDIMRSLTADP